MRQSARIHQRFYEKYNEEVKFGNKKVVPALIPSDFLKSDENENS